MSGYSRLARNSAARKALLRDLITDLILNGSIQTTLTKANELKRLADKMVSIATAGQELPVFGINLKYFPPVSLESVL